MRPIVCSLFLCRPRRPRASAAAPQGLIVQIIYGIFWKITPFRALHHAIRRRLPSDRKDAMAPT
ncbi:hypothetical protein CCR83_04250, partial [Rhodobacter veldkampii DSM 11550]|nr:hypothetical protein [Phaeovulum veldkampii DSM 11550]